MKDLGRERHVDECGCLRVDIPRRTRRSPLAPCVVGLTGLIRGRPAGPTPPSAHPRWRRRHLTQGQPRPSCAARPRCGREARSSTGTSPLMTSKPPQSARSRLALPARSSRTGGGGCCSTRPVIRSARRPSRQSRTDARDRLWRGSGNCRRREVLSPPLGNGNCAVRSPASGHRSHRACDSAQGSAC